MSTAPLASTASKATAAASRASGARNTGGFIPAPVLSLLPGIVASASVAALATAIGGRLPLIGAPVLAIVLGLAISAVRPPSVSLRPGLRFTGRKVLQGSIIVLGLELSLRQVATIGAGSLPVLVGTLLSALAGAWVAGRALRLRRDLFMLIGVGTAICGASAIAAADAVIDAEEADVSYAVTTIFLFNVVAVLAYPPLGHLLGLSQRAFGLFAGTAINDASSVVAASTVYGHQAATYGVVVKLTRTLAIIPICVGLSLLRGPRESTAISDRVTLTGPLSLLRRAFPLFVLGFVAAAAANSLGLVPTHLHPGLSEAAMWMITAALASIGLSSQQGQMRKAGIRPLLLGAILWLTVGLASLGLQAVTGKL